MSERGGILFPEPFENQARIRSAEAKRVGHGDIDLSLSRRMGNVVQIALGIGGVEVYGRRQNAAFQRNNRDDRFYTASGAKQMPGHRLCRAYRDLIGMFTKHCLDGGRFE